MRTRGSTAGRCELVCALVTALFFTAWLEASAQQPMPSQKEIDEVMQAMQRQLESLTPEQRQMIEQSQRRLPSRPDPGTDDGLAVPKRDAARIAKLPSAPLTGAQLKGHVEALQPKIASALTPAGRDRAQKIEAELRKGTDATARIRGAANGLAAWGAWPEATYLMGKAALASGSAQDLNNLAAFLTMQRASQAAMPILLTLNARHPDNSTLLNNLGQAWFELGDVKEAEKHLTLAIRRSPNHPQANVTKSQIDAARGDKSAAVESMRKAIQGGYAESKARRLAQLGGSLQKGDVRWTLPMPEDPLGLSKLAPPPYPRTMADLPIAIPAWREFLTRTSMLSAQANQAFARSIAQGSGDAARTSAVPGPLAAKASRVSAFDRDVLAQKQGNLARETQQVQAQLQQDWMQTGNRIAAVRARCAAQPDPPPRCGCGEIGSIVDAYLQNWNGQLEPLQREWLAWSRRRAAAEAYFAQYTQPEAQFARTKQMAVGGFASTLASVKAAGVLNAEVSYCKPEEQKPSRIGRLANFDDLHCEHIVHFEVPGFGSIDVRCNRMDTVLEPVLLPLAAKWTEDLARDRVISASAEIGREVAGVDVKVGGHAEFDEAGVKSGGVSAGAGAGIGKVVAGPLEVGISAEGRVGVEFDRTGVTDIRLDGGVKSAVASKVGDPEGARSGAQASANLKGNWSWNAGAGGSASQGFNRNLF